MHLSEYGGVCIGARSLPSRMVSYTLKLAAGGLASAALYYGILRICKDATLQQLLGLLQGRCKKPWQTAILNKLGW